MERKKCNNKVRFMAHGNEAVFRLSDKELRMLRHSSIWYKGDNWENFVMGYIYNFSVFALFDYDIKGSKAGRFNSIFDYHKFDKMWWCLED